MSIRRAASCCHPLQLSVRPRGARTTRAAGVRRRGVMTSPSANSPRATASASAAMSPASTRSSVSVGTSARTVACARSIARARAQRTAVVDPLHRAHELDAEDVLHVAHDPAQLPRRAHRHRHDVFLAAVGRDRVHARRMREHLALARDRRGGHLRHHEARVHAGVAREERREPLVQVRVHEAVDAPLGHRRRGSSSRSRGSRAPSRRPARGSCRRRASCRRRTRAGCRSRRSARARSRPRRRRSRRAPARAPAACSAARTRPARADRPCGATRGWRCSASSDAEERRRGDLPGLAARVVDAARRTRPACRAAPRATRRPRRAPCARACARRPTASAAIAGVRLRAVDQRESFLRAEHDRREPRRREHAPRPGRARPRPRGSRSPSPMSESARCASGARSPLAPTLPCSGTSGQRSALSIAQSSSGKRGARAGESLREDVRAQQHHRAHLAPRQRSADARRRGCARGSPGAPRACRAGSRRRRACRSPSSRRTRLRCGRRDPRPPGAWRPCAPGRRRRARRARRPRPRRGPARW